MGKNSMVSHLVTMATGTLKENLDYFDIGYLNMQYEKNRRPITIALWYALVRFLKKLVLKESEKKS